MVSNGSRNWVVPEAHVLLRREIVPGVLPSIPVTRALLRWIAWRRDPETEAEKPKGLGHTALHNTTEAEKHRSSYCTLLSSRLDRTQPEMVASLLRNSVVTAFPNAVERVRPLPDHVPLGKTFQTISPIG